MTRGGKREGAGRPLGSTKPKTKTKVTFWLPTWLFRLLQKMPGSQGKIVERALIGFYKLRRKGKA
ncbi:hypothetical protein LCGC14_2134180 [marine sediment metagenome]|uniref:Uncharacterized protein n=1 Tax=marine sediment metagenome TaxID=412755 RepID=A0A0F9GWL2_9ZZZZ